jgi:hypothetical protein
LATYSDRRPIGYVRRARLCFCDVSRIIVSACRLDKGGKARTVVRAICPLRTIYEKPRIL